MLLLVFHCYITNYHKFSSFKQYLSSQFCRAGSTAFCAQSLTGLKLECQSGWALIWGFWQNSVPFSCRADLAVFLLVVSGGSLSAAKGGSIHRALSLSAMKKPLPSNLSRFESLRRPLFYHLKKPLLLKA